MHPCRTSAHSPKLKVCPCLFYWVWSQKSWSCPLFCLDLRTWGAPGRPAAQPSAATPAGERKQKTVRAKNAVYQILQTWYRLSQNALLDSLPVQVCIHKSLPPPWPQGQRPALLSLMRSTLENTLHTPHTLLSSDWQNRGWNSTWRGTNTLSTWAVSNTGWLKLTLCYTIHVIHPFTLMHYTCNTAGGILQLCISSLMCAGV